MAEITTVSKETRTYQRPPLMIQRPAAGVDLYTRFGLARYVPPPEPKPKKKIPTLQGLLSEYDDLPAQSVILGVDEEGLPVLVEINEPEPGPGSILIVGDERQQQINLLRTAIESVVWRNSARGVQFLVLSHLPGAWRSWVSEKGYERYCLGVHGVNELAAQEWVQRLTEWAEERQSGARVRPPVLLLLDTLSFLPKLSSELREEFNWLAKEGPKGYVWPIAAISTALANALSRQIGIFKTTIYGYTDDEAFYTKLAGLDENAARRFVAPGQFAVKTREDGKSTWLKFHLLSSE